MSVEIPGITYANIVDNIVVHLGKPDEEAENVTVPFIDYIKNVASSELYPTWPENALRANIHAIVSVALNRIFTQWYRARGYNFDITNSPQYDQAFVYNRGTFDNISNIVDEIFDIYIRRNGHIEPMFAQFCDGRITQCDGMSQWGTVELADRGYTPLEIIRYYYGEDVSLVVGPRETFRENFRQSPIGPGDSGIDVMIAQFYLNRISVNFPGIPKIASVDGYYSEETANSVRKFQQVFGLPQTGIIDVPTWNRIRNIFNAVSRLAELASRGILFEDVSRQFSGVLSEGTTGSRVALLQFFLNLLSAFYPTITTISMDGYFGPETKNAVREFQRITNLPITGIVDNRTWDILYDDILGIITTLSPEAISFPPIVYPNVALMRGMGTEQPAIFAVQEMLALVSTVIPDITYVPYNLIDGVFGPITESAVRTFQRHFGLNPNGIVDEATWNKLVEVYNDLRYGDEEVLRKYINT